MKLRLLPRAQVDLLEIEAWLQRERPQTWERQLDAIIMGLDQLERHPLSGPVCRDERLALRGFRTIMLGRYVAFYKVQCATVFVYRLLGQKQSWKQLI